MEKVCVEAQTRILSPDSVGKDVFEIYKYTISQIFPFFNGFVKFSKNPRMKKSFSVFFKVFSKIT